MGFAAFQETPPGQAASETATPGARTELQLGTKLTRSGEFKEAVPHLLAAQRAGGDPYAAAVNLAICYLGLNAFKDAVQVLENVSSSGFNTPLLKNLLSQAYLADDRPALAWKAFQDAARLAPQDEKLYDYVADACTDHHAYALGLQVADVGLRNLPNSPRLHYERALFLARLDRLEEGKPEFDRVIQLAPESYLANLALVQKEMYNQEFLQALQHLRQVVRSGHRDYQTLSLLGTVMLHVGVTPGEADFAEARAVLEESASENPKYSATQIALGQLDTLENRFASAQDHFECARALEPANPAIYAGLAHVYRKLGDAAKASQMQKELQRILADKKSANAAVPR